VRVVVVPVIRDELGRVLLCQMARDRGVFPGQWGLPGGGVEAGETLEKLLPDGSRQRLSMGRWVTLERGRLLYERDRAGSPLGAATNRSVLWWGEGVCMDLVRGKRLERSDH
jgi:8-oxo-dGTP pyrophosphatase MutT (NUDIX family)